MTGASQLQAQSFLVRSNYNFQNAINLFFDEGIIPEIKKLQHTKQIDLLFEKLSSIDLIKQAQTEGVKQIDQQKFSEFIDTYFHVNQQNLIIPHILINIMKVSKSGHINSQSFYNLFLYLGQFYIQNTRCQSPGELSKYTKQLEQQIYHDQQNFKSLYMNTYGFYLCGKQITLDYELAVQIWKLYFKHKMIFYQQFVEYCECVCKKPKKVHKDLWKMVYEFTQTVKDINTVKEDDGWPVFLDDFVEWLKIKPSKMIIQ